MVGIFILDQHLGCIPYKSEATFFAAWKWDEWRDNIQQMEVLVGSSNLDDLAAKEQGHFFEWNIQCKQVDGRYTVPSLDMAQSNGERFYYAF